MRLIQLLAVGAAMSAGCARPAPAPAAGAPPASVDASQSAGSVDPAPCSPIGQPYFEFQTERPAAFRPDPAISPRPAAPAPRPRVLVQFMVDPTGRPEPETFKVLRAPADADLASIRAALPQWRFRPALLGGCAVRQLVQVPVEWEE